MDASQDGNDISFCWVPSHVGIWGNEIADWTAKAALQLNTSDWKVPASDFRRCAQEYIYEQWDIHWLVNYIKYNPILENGKEPTDPLG